MLWVERSVGVENTRWIVRGLGVVNVLEVARVLLR